MKRQTREKGLVVVSGNKGAFIEENALNGDELGGRAVFTFDSHANPLL